MIYICAMIVGASSMSLGVIIGSAISNSFNKTTLEAVQALVGDKER